MSNYLKALLAIKNKSLRVYNTNYERVYSKKCDVDKLRPITDIHLNTCIYNTNTIIYSSEWISPITLEALQNHIRKLNLDYIDRDVEDGYVYDKYNDFIIREKDGIIILL